VPRKRRDLTGQRFGRLTAVALVERKASDGSLLWLCLCDCGKEKVLLVANFKHGNTKSCGCRRVEMLKARKRK